MPEKTENRVLFLDNLRYLMIAFVVLQHTGNGYATITKSWYVWDGGTSIDYFNTARMIIDVFIMPILFFIAGYFAFPNIERKGTGVFIKDKLRRIGLPWLVCVILIVPIVSYIQHYKRLGGQALSNYGQFWLNWLNTASDFHTGYLYSKPANLFFISADKIHFNHTAYWYLSVLLFFFIAFGILYSLRKRFFPSFSLQETVQSGRTMLLVMLWVGILCIAARALINLIPYPNANPWVLVGNVLQFQTWRLPAYAIYFALGIYAYSKKWFVRGNIFPGHPVVWLSICAALGFAYIVVIKSSILNPSNAEIRFLSICVLSFLRAAFLILFAGVLFRYWNRPNKIHESLAASSYDIYLAHLPVVVLIQWLLVDLVGIPSLIKYGMVFSSSFLVCYLISRYVMNPHPRVSVATVCLIFVLMIIFIHPL